MKKAVSLLVAMLMILSVVFSVPATAYASESTNAINATESNGGTEEESVFMRIIHTIFFSKLTFDSDGGSEVPYQYAFKFFGRFSTPANPTKEGYTFDGWEPAIPSRAPFGNVNVKAKWSTNIYNVKWIVDGVTYSTVDLPYGVGISKPEDPQKEGYTFTGWAPAVATSMPARDITYTAQFSVNQYSATLNAGAGKFTDGTSQKKITADYGTTINYEEPTREGYDFAGWDIVVPATMPAQDFSCNATWVAKTDITYTVYIYVMDVNGTYYLNQKNLLKGETDTTVSYTPKPDTGFQTASNSILSAKVAADGSTILKVYYARKQFAIKFNLDNGTAVTSKNYYYGATVTPPQNPQKDGYNFIGWTPVLATVTKSVTYKAEWKKATEYTQASTEEEYIEECARLFDESVNNDSFNSAEALNDPYYMGRLIVTCDDYSLIDFDKYEAKEVVFGTDGTVVLQFENRDKAEECAKILETLSTVEAVTADAYLEMEDYEVEPIPSLNNEPDWGVKYINADKYSYYLKNTTKDKSVTVAVLDTGIDMDHPYLTNIISKGGVNYTGTGKTPEDDQGHGTHVSGIIKQCTEGLNINILPVKVLKRNDEGKATGSLKWIINGISWAVQNGADIINLSLEVPANPIITDQIQIAIDYATSKGVTVIVAAGNGDSNNIPVDTSIVAPANIGSAIVVGAIDKNGVKGSFSNYGETVDVCAPGVEIVSTYLKTAEYPYEYGKLDGTSQAAPHIAAVAAMFKYLNKDLTPNQLETLVKNYCIDKGPTGRDDFYGEGCPNMYNAIPDCTLSFNVDGGSSISSSKVKSTETIVLPNPSKYYKVTFDTCGGTAVNSYNSQCTFGGWFESSSLSGTSHPAKESYMVKENGTLYAKWTAKGFEAPQSPTKNHFTFSGWYTAKTGGTRLTANYEIKDNITVYAQWTAVQYEAEKSAVPPGTTIVSSRTEYKFRDKSEMRSTNSPGAEWTKDVSAEVNWGNEVGPVYSNPTNGQRNVRSEQYVTGYNTTGYRYWRYCASNGIGSGNYQGGSGKVIKVYTLNTKLTTKDSKATNGDQGYRLYHPSKNTADYNPSNPNSGSYYWVVWECGSSYNHKGDAAQDFEVKSPVYSTRWYYQEPLYLFYKWSGWSNWTSTKHTKTSTHDVQTREICTYVYNS